MAMKMQYLNQWACEFSDKWNMLAFSLNDLVSVINLYNMIIFMTKNCVIFHFVNHMQYHVRVSLYDQHFY